MSTLKSKGIYFINSGDKYKGVPTRVKCRGFRDENIVDTPFLCDGTL